MSPLTAVWAQFQDQVPPENFANSMSWNPFTHNWTTLTINTQPSSESKSESKITFLIFKKTFPYLHKFSHNFFFVSKYEVDGGNHVDLVTERSLHMELEHMTTFW